MALNRPTVSVVVPVFNEERRLPSLLETLKTDASSIVSAAGAHLLEVIVVDDGSSDRTHAILEEAGELTQTLTVITRPHRGKGAAVRSGMLAARGDLALMTDVDLSTPLNELSSLLAAVGDGADVAIASRGLRDSNIVVHQPPHRELMGRTFNLLLRILAGIPWRDTQCGFKLFRLAGSRRLFELQRIDGFAFDAELLVNARRLGLDVAEIPVSWTDNPDTRVGLVFASTRMGLDALRIAYWARRPLPADSLITAPRELPRM